MKQPFDLSYDNCRLIIHERLQQGRLRKMLCLNLRQKKNNTEDSVEFKTSPEDIKSPCMFLFAMSHITIRNAKCIGVG